jgi:hypothetical protein
MFVDKHRLAAGLLLLASACASDAASELPPEKPRSAGYPQPYHLLPLLRLDNQRLPETANLIAKTGNRREKAEAGQRLTQLTEVVASPQWRQQQLPTIARMHPGRLSDQRRKGLLDDWQRRHQVRLYDAMRALGSEPVLDYCLAVSKADDRPATEQQLALGVLANHGRAKVGPSTAGPAWGMPSAAPGSPGYNPSYAGAGQANSPWNTPGQGQAKPAAPAEAPRVSGGHIINVNQVVDTLRPYFIVCYQRALAEFGRFGAWIIVEADVSSRTGMPTHVGGKGDDGIPPSMMKCLYDVVKQAQFAPPEGGDARVSIPLTFTQG